MGGGGGRGEEGSGGAEEEKKGERGEGKLKRGRESGEIVRRGD